MRVAAVRLGLSVLALGALTACGSKQAGSDAPSAPPSTVALNGKGAEQRLTVHIGDRFTLDVPVGADVAELGTKELRDEGGNTFHAIGVGTATIEVTRRPSCAPGQMCSQLIQLVGTVRVTIKP